MGRQKDEFISYLVRLARENTGIALIETWECEKCEAACVYFHAMEESFSCFKCGHRHASKLPRYQRACEAGAEAEVAFKEPPFEKGSPFNG